MPQYRYVPPSVDEQKTMYRKRYKKSNRKRRFFSILAVASVFLAGGYWVNRGQPVQNVQVAAEMEPAMPTEIDANFMAQVEKCFIPTAAAYGYTLRISSGFRSGEEQNELYLQGREINGHIVTEAPAGKSIHNYGFAVDVVDRWRGFDINWDKLGRIGSYCGLEQASEGDLPHFEHRGGLTTDDFKKGMRPPSLTLPCPIMAERFEAGQKITKSDLQSCGAPDFNRT